MTSGAQSKFPRTGAITVVLVLALLVYSVKLLWRGGEDTMARVAELCSSIVPALQLSQVDVNIISTEVENDGATVRVFYHLDASGRTGRRRWMICTFDLTAGFYGEPQLQAVETDTGKLGEGRLFVIKRWWLDGQDTIHNVGEERGRLEFGPA